MNPFDWEKQLQKLRKQMTQESIARKLDVSLSYLRSLEKNRKSNPTIKLVKKIWALYNISCGRSSTRE